MCKYVLVLSLLGLISCVAGAEAPQGFLWYNLPDEQRRAHDLEHKKPGVAFNQLSYTDRDAVLHFYTMEALHKVRFTHQVEDERVFLAFQQYWLEEATRHGRVNQATLLQYPEYDFSVTHPTSHLGTQISRRVADETEKKQLKQIAERAGFLFFYRSSNPYDQQQIPILKAFCEQFHFKLMPVSMDGQYAVDLPNSRLDAGQAKALGVRYFPALLLVNPSTQAVRPIAYGLTTQDVIKHRLLTS